MKLVRQVTLHYIGGSSRKAYEVDLNEVDDGRFVVNYRFGRIGTHLRDGTKTAAPVSREQAQRIFDDLVREKLAGGYVEVGSRSAERAAAAPPAAPVASAVAPSADGLDARRRAVLEQLHLAVTGGGTRPLGRLAWRAGELRIRQAGPLLVAALTAPAPDAPPPASRPFLRLVKRAAPPANLATVVAFSALDGVGRLRTQDGRELKFGGSAVRGFVPVEGMEVLYEDVEPHPLGGERARVVKLTPEGEAARDAEKKKAEATSKAKQAEAFAARQRTLTRHALVWALGRTGEESALEPLARLFFAEAGGERSALGRAAGVSLLQIATGDERRRVLEQLAAELPPGVAAAVGADDVEAIERAVRQHLDPGRLASYQVLDTLAFFDGGARAMLLRWAREVPLAPPLFKRVRHLFKVAEQREDWELFGLLAWRFEKTPAFYASPRYGRHTYIQGRWTPVDDELKGDASRLAYGSRTRRYLRRRVWRTLRRLGEADDAGFVPAAVGVLLPFTDEDKKPSRRSLRVEYGPGGWQDRRDVVTHYDGFAGYWAFNHLLYRHSPRYELPRGANTFRCREGHPPGEPVPTVREEAFPGLWDAQPRGLFHLLTESGCTPVLEHAARALAAQPEASLDDVDEALLVALLRRDHLIPARVGFTLVERRLATGRLGPDVVVGLAACIVDEAREVAARWVGAHAGEVLADPALFSGVLLAPFAEGREALARLLEGRPAPERARELLTRVAADLLALDGSDPVLSEAVALLSRVWPAILHDVGPAVLRDLLASPAEAAQLLAARALIGRAHLDELPEELLLLPLGSEHASVRALGVEVVGSLPDSVLAERLALLRDLCRSPHGEVRQAVGPLLTRLAPAFPDLAADLATLLVGTLLRPEASEGVHADVLALLLGPLRAGLEHAGADLVWRLLDARSAVAHQLGGELLKTQVAPDDVGLLRLARLNRHPVLAVREAAWSLAERSEARLKQNMADAIRLLDSPWEDARQWAMGFFGERFSAEDLTPIVLVGICDSVRPDVQQFGRDLITRFFDDAFGPEYLEKLSEHPSERLQLFASSWLTRFARDDAERLAHLELYFLTVLGKVNQGGVTKQRVYAFLAEEAQKSAEEAAVVARVLGRQSATIAITDRARAIAVLTDIAQRWPSVEVPVVVREPEVRRGV